MQYLLLVLPKSVEISNRCFLGHFAHWKKWSNKQPPVVDGIKKPPNIYQRFQNYPINYKTWISEVTLLKLQGLQAPKTIHI